MFRVSRSRRGRDGTLDHRMAIFAAGAACALAGIGLGIGWLVTVAIGILAVGFVLGILERRRNEQEAPEPEP